MGPENEPVPAPKCFTTRFVRPSKARTAHAVRKIVCQARNPTTFRKSGVSARERIVVPRGRKCFAETRIGQIWLWSLNLGLTAGKRLPS
jgi:hypothetical protein